MNRVAVLAHYDVDALGDSYVIRILEQLAACCDRVICVSTSGINTLGQSLPEKVEVLVRENEGYDFCSYRAGINLIDDICLYDQLLLLNDSFYIGEEFNLSQILNSASGDIFSLTASWQIAYHLQSFFLLFDKTTLHSSWFVRFWMSVVPLKNKFQTVIKYEIGLSQSAKNQGFSLRALFQLPQLGQDELNPVHHAYLRIFEEYAFVKIDLFRLGLSGTTIEDFAHQRKISDEIIRHQHRTARHYYGKKLSFDNPVVLDRGIFDFYRAGVRGARVAIIAHLYYPELSVQFKSFLSRIPEDIDMYVTVTDYAALGHVAQVFSSAVDGLYLSVTENRGRDVRPFFTLMKGHDFRCYDCILKLHGKKSTYSDLGGQWRDTILEGLLPSTRQIAKLISHFRKGSQLGIAAPGASYLAHDMYWGANRQRVEEILTQHLGLSGNNARLFFIGGTMFWFSPKALLTLVDHVDLGKFEPEEGQQDGTYAHVLERTFCAAAISSGMYPGLVEAPATHATRQAAESNRVIVLPSR